MENSTPKPSKPKAGYYQKPEDVERRILEAAQKVFIIKGVDATSMSDIAREAKISRPSLHYYFRTKDNLFHEVFRGFVFRFMPTLAEIVRGNGTVDEKIRIFIDKYVELLARNPLTPHFLLNEIFRDPTNMSRLFLEIEARYGCISQAIGLIDEFAKKKKLKNFDARHYCLLLYGQCIAPFMLIPLLENTFFERNSTRFEDYVARVKTNITRNALLSIGVPDIN